jgi:FMN reductase
MTNRTLAVVTAGLSQPSSTRLLADRLTAATRSELDRLGEPVEVTVIELREYAHDLMNHLLTGFAPAALKEAIDAVATADGLIAVTPIFNASYSGLFKSFFDVIDDTMLTDKPVLAAATGGTARHSLAVEHALRPMFSYLHAVVVPTSVFAATEDWAGSSGVDPGLRNRIRRAAGELADLIHRRPATAATDPFTLTQTFDQLLAG